MPRLALIASLLAFALFNYSQYMGWSLFADDSPPAARASPGSSYISSHGYHK